MSKATSVGVYLDACVWKQFVHMDEDGSESSAKAFRIVSSGRFALICSSILQVEALSYSLSEQLGAYDSEKVKVVFVDQGTCKLAYDLRKEQFDAKSRGQNVPVLKTGDALHLACAIQGRARFLISRDGKISKATKITGHAGRLEVLTPEEFCTRFDDVINKAQLRLELSEN